MYRYVFGNTWGILGHVFEVYVNSILYSLERALRLPPHFSPYHLWWTDFKLVPIISISWYQTFVQSTCLSVR